jgi:hypothetical protein
MVQRIKSEELDTHSKRQKTLLLTNAEGQKPKWTVLSAAAAEEKSKNHSSF